MAQINKPTDYFNTKLYTGNGSTQSITGVGFQPDFIWNKQRNGTYEHYLFNSIIGTGKFLKSNSTSAEGTNVDTVTSFDSDGFTLGSAAGNNGSGNTMVSWNWLASNTTASNTDGSITSTVSANTTSGFSIGTYTGTNVDNTVGHGLEVAPSMIIVKCTSTAHDWVVYHSALGSGSAIALNLTDASYGATGWQNTEPTSTVFSIDNAANSVNQSGQSFVFYAFAEKKGFSKAFSYTGNGSTDGSFTYLGFRPAFCIIKRTDSASDWVILDNKRNSFNVVDKKLESSNSDADTTQTACDFLSNGIKLKDTTTSYLGTNISGGTYIGIAFAENPIVGSNGVPSCAR